MNNDVITFQDEQQSMESGLGKAMESGLGEALDIPNLRKLTIFSRKNIETHRLNQLILATGREEADTDANFVDVRVEDARCKTMRLGIITIEQGFQVEKGDKKEEKAEGVNQKCMGKAQRQETDLSTDGIVMQKGISEEGKNSDSVAFPEREDLQKPDPLSESDIALNERFYESLFRRPMQEVIKRTHEVLDKHLEGSEAPENREEMAKDITNSILYINFETSPSETKKKT